MKDQLSSLRNFVEEMKATSSTNAKKEIIQNKLLKIDFDFLLNNAAKTNLSLGLFYADNKRSFYCNGEMGAYNLAKLNGILKPLAKIEIANCKLKQLQIKLKGDEMGVNANISMKYKNLRVKVLAVDSRDNQLKHQIENHKKADWELDSQYVDVIFKAITASALYKDYMQTRVSDFKDDKEFIVDAFKDIIAPNEKLYEYIEDKNLPHLI